MTAELADGTIPIERFAEGMRARWDALLADEELAVHRAATINLLATTVPAHAAL